MGGFRNRRVTFSVHRVHFLWALVSDCLYRRSKRIIFIVLCTEFTPTNLKRILILQKSQNGKDCLILSSPWILIQMKSLSLNLILCFFPTWRVSNLPSSTPIAMSSAIIMSLNSKINMSWVRILKFFSNNMNYVELMRGEYLICW